MADAYVVHATRRWAVSALMWTYRHIHWQRVCVDIWQHLRAPLLHLTLRRCAYGPSVVLACTWHLQVVDVSTAPCRPAGFGCGL